VTWSRGEDPRSGGRNQTSLTDLMITRGKAGSDRFKDELKKSMDTSIQETINKEANIYKSVTYSDDMSEFEIVVDRKALEDSWSFAGFGFLVTAGFYQAFLGVDESERFVILNYVDEKTGEVFDTVDSRTLDEEN
jgi:hypothetical protein